MGAFVIDSDLVGTHSRLQLACSLTSFMADMMGQVMDRMHAADEVAGVYGGHDCLLNEEKDLSGWLGKSGVKAKLDNEKPQAMTVNYDELVAPRPV